MPSSIQGTFTTSLPNGTDYTYSQNLSINDAAVALSAGSIIGSGPGYVKTRMLNFFDFPSKQFLNSLLLIITLSALIQ